MAQSFSKIYLHIIFHIKTTSPQIRDEDLARAHAYVGQLINDAGCVNVWTDGVGDHIHVLCLLGREVTIAYLVEEVKNNSSRWIKAIDPIYHTFAWQSGYAAFSLSQSVVDRTLAYVKNQREHHRKLTFAEEYIAFLKLYGIEYDEQYVFTD